MTVDVSLVKCTSYNPDEVSSGVRQAIDLLGGMAKFIRPQSKVLVKPNLLMAAAPEAGITTHPEVVRGIVRMLREINCRVFLGDSPSVFGKEIENVERVYETTGMKKLCAEEGVELVKFDKRKWRGKFPLTSWLGECDYLVNLPKFKTHNLTGLTAAVKNLFGLVCGTYKTEIHKNFYKAQDFSRAIVDIYAQARPALSLVDGVVAMEADGPASSGKLRQMNLLAASSDCVALDAVLACVMGLTPQDILTTKEAAARNLGQADMGSINIVGENLSAVRQEKFILPTASLLSSKIPAPLAQLARKMIRHYPWPVRKNCTRCTACIQACPKKVISMHKKGIVFDYSGCIACFCCQEVCPAAAIRVKKSLLAKLIGL